MNNNALDDFLRMLKDGFPDFSRCEHLSIYSMANDGDYPIHYAVIQGKLDIVKEMLASGVDVNVVGANGATPLDKAILHEHSEIAAYLLSVGGEAAYE